jgi:hypothetical protein
MFLTQNGLCFERKQIPRIDMSRWRIDACMECMRWASLFHKQEVNYECRPPPRFLGCNYQAGWDPVHGGCVAIHANASG